MATVRDMSSEMFDVPDWQRIDREGEIKARVAARNGVVRIQRALDEPGTAGLVAAFQSLPTPPETAKLYQATMQLALTPGQAPDEQLQLKAFGLWSATELLRDVVAERLGGHLPPVAGAPTQGFEALQSHQDLNRSQLATLYQRLQQRANALAAIQPPAEKGTEGVGVTNDPVYFTASYVAQAAQSAAATLEPDSPAAPKAPGFS